MLRSLVRAAADKLTVGAGMTQIRRLNVHEYQVSLCLGREGGEQSVRAS